MYLCGYILRFVTYWRSTGITERALYPGGGFKLCHFTFGHAKVVFFKSYKSRNSASCLPTTTRTMAVATPNRFAANSVFNCSAQAMSVCLCCAQYCFLFAGSPAVSDIKINLVNYDWEHKTLGNHTDQYINQPLVNVRQIELELITKCSVY